jgi:hypothetical protein
MGHVLYGLTALIASAVCLLCIAALAVDVRRGRARKEAATDRA